MVRVPISQMLNVRILRFDLAEERLLVLAVLKEARCRTLCGGARRKDALQLNVVVGTLLRVSADQAAASFVRIIEVTLIENRVEHASGNCDRDWYVFRSKHGHGWRSSLCRQRTTLVEAVLSAGVESLC